MGHFSVDIHITEELGKGKPIHVTAASWVENSVLQAHWHIY
jgi:hypothetical protein